MNLTGKTNCLLFPGDPEGLSFLKTISPVEYFGSLKDIFATNGTELVVVQSVSAWATPTPKTAPSLSKTLTPKTPSKYHPVASPDTLIGEEIKSFAFKEKIEKSL